MVLIGLNVMQQSEGVPAGIENSEIGLLRRALEEGVQFDRLVGELAAGFVSVPAEQFDDAIQDAQRRIAAMTGTNDGFRIAEVDLELRGPGDFFGTRQSGLPEFRVADLLRDGAMLEEARREAFALVQADPQLTAFEHRGLREALLARWRGKLDLAGIG